MDRLNEQLAYWRSRSKSFDTPIRQTHGNLEKLIEQCITRRAASATATRSATRLTSPNVVASARGRITAPGYANPPATPRSWPNAGFKNAGGEKGIEGLTSERTGLKLKLAFP
jgi:hypothetical protein